MSDKIVKEKSPSFEDYPAVHMLAKLAKHPYSLHEISSERLRHFTVRADGWTYLYGTEQLTEETVFYLQALAEQSKAVEKMRHMQSGKIMNYIHNHPSENRSVLHTATRNFFGRIQIEQGAKEATFQAKEELNKLSRFINEIDGVNSFDHLIMIGIGGSDLGPKAHYHALRYLKKSKRTVHFISNIDPDASVEAISGLNLKRALVVVVSKSGSTIETAVNEEFLRKKFQEKNLDPSEHFVAITTAGSKMDIESRYRQIFYLWDWVGGRYSTTSVVGGFLISFMCGFEHFYALLDGANAMDAIALNDDFNKNLPLFAALISIWNRNFLHYPTLAIIPYSDSLYYFPSHIQQLAMESNGKQIDQNGDFVSFKTEPIVWGAPGTDAQHSFFQLLHQGTDKVPLHFIGFKFSQHEEDFDYNGTSSQQKLQANLIAQALSLAVGEKSDNPNKTFLGDRPSSILLCEKLTPYALGSLLAFYEHLVAFQGFVWGINSFDQEGVQLGKVMASAITDLQRGIPPEKLTKRDELATVILEELNRFGLERE